VSISRTGRPCHSHSLLAEQPVDQRRLARIRPADDRQLQRTVRRVLVLRRILVIVDRAIGFEQGAQRIEQIGQPLAMFGAERQRLAEAECERLVDACLPGAALRLVGDEDHGRILAAQPAGDLLIQRHHADARIDQEQSRIRLAHCGLRLRSHAAR
jgi:hypothetical protein